MTNSTANGQQQPVLDGNPMNREMMKLSAALERRHRGSAQRPADHYLVPRDRGYQRLFEEPELAVPDYLDARRRPR